MKKTFLSLFVLCSFIFVFAGISKSHKTYKIKTKTVHYVSGKDTVTAYLAEPAGQGKFPALIVIHEWWGLTPWIKGNADSFAKKGYIALAIDLYRGKVTNDPKVASELSRALPEDRAITDVKTAFDYLSRMPNVEKKKIGSIGWCFGGGFSLDAALNISSLAACSVNYGELVTEEKSLKKINCPVLEISGNKDVVVTPQSVSKFASAAKSAGKNVRTKIFSGVGHAFMNPANTKGYNKATADSAWEMIYAFLDKNLKK
jgi:carboxymethylenebutenolidase